MLLMSTRLLVVAAMLLSVLAQDGEKRMLRRKKQLQEQLPFQGSSAEQLQPQGSSAEQFPSQGSSTEQLRPEGRQEDGNHGTLVRRKKKIIVSKHKQGILSIQTGGKRTLKIYFLQISSQKRGGIEKSVKPRDLSSAHALKGLV